MLKLNGTIPGKENIRNIIFDFGGVICDIDVNRTIEKFKEFGPPGSGIPVSPEEENRHFEFLVDHFETGEITPDQFRETIRKYYKSSPDDTAIDDAWNALLVGIPASRIRILEDLRPGYRIFLLSNTNEIHYLSYSKDFREKTGYKSFDDLFEKAWFSHRIGLRKPGREIFDFVLSDKDLKPEETLFIDDTPENIEGALSSGMHGFLLKKGATIHDIFQIK